MLLVRDGVHDATAFAFATIGAAMGRHGSDRALETADAVVVGDNLSTIPSVIELARRAHRFIVANLIVSPEH